MEAAVAAFHERLEGAGVPHAFGGAFALNFYGGARPTADIDVNVFESAQVSEVKFDWEGTPVHLFLSSDPLHEAMEREIREVPLGDGTIPLVSPEHLIVRKTLLGRPKDRQDIEAILAATPVDLEEIDAWVKRLTS